MQGPQPDPIGRNRTRDGPVQWRSSRSRATLTTEEVVMLRHPSLMFACCVAVAVAASPGARAAPPETTAQIEAQRMWSAFLKADLEGFARFSHPNVVKMNGGKRQLLELLRKGWVEMKKQGVSVESSQIERPSRAVQAGRELHLVVPMKMVMKRPEGRFLVRSYLIGVSADDGRTWSFVDGATVTAVNVRKVLPNFSARLTLPAVAPPEELK
jgi:hypothetical protein